MEKIYKVHGITCQKCKDKIEGTLRNEKGVEEVNVHLKKKSMYIDYDEKQIKASRIKNILHELGYEVENYDTKKRDEHEENNVLMYVGLALLAFLVLSKFVPDFSLLLTEGKSVSSVMLFIIGITTSFHCISMCGGIALSQVVAEKDNMKRNIMYNIGRVISYTVLGGIVGFLGAGITLGNRLYGIVPILLGGMMIIVGLGNAGVLSLGQWKVTQKFNIKLGQIKARFGADKGPFVLGLLNGLMPCGPLQLMQIYALSTGSFLDGALAMFAFSLGTVPLMLGMGAFIHKLSIKSRVMVYKMGGYLILVLGLSMVMNGMGTLGIQVGPGGTNRGKGSSVSSQGNDVEGAKNKSTVRMEDGYQIVEVDVLPRGYQDIVVQKGIPVKMIFNVPLGGLNGCNYAINIPEYDIFTALQEGENSITFEPTEEGKFMYSCWMGMIRHTITVVDGPVEDYVPTEGANSQNNYYNFSGGGLRCH